MGQVDREMQICVSANHGTLLDILDKFPSYDLQPELGSERAIRDIENKMSDFPSFKAELHCEEPKMEDVSKL